jgi:PAS domain S-box-containing protein
LAGTNDIHQQIVEASPDGLWVVDARGRTLFANARVAELLGRSESEVAGIGVADVLEGASRECYLAHLAELNDGAATHDDVERVYHRSDGTPVPLRIHESRLRADDGSLIGYALRLTDDGRRRALLAELTRSRSQLADAQAIARMGSWEVQVEPREVTWSPELYHLLEVDPETFEPGPEAFIARLVEEDQPLVTEEWESLAVEPGERSVDARVALDDGSVRWVRTLGRVLERGSDGTPLRFGGTVQDIHDLKQTEHRLRAAVEVNVLMQFMATAANETSTLVEALGRLRELLLADDDWERGVAFTVTPDGLRGRPLGPGETDVSTALEAEVGARALHRLAPVIDEQVLPGSIVVGFPVLVDGGPVVVVVVTARAPLRHRAVLEGLVIQVAGQLGHVAVREALVAELNSRRAQLSAAQEIARVGSWEMRLDATDQATCSDQLYAVLDVDPGVWVPGLDTFMAQLVEDDRDPVLEAYALALVEPGEHMVDARVVMRDGTPRWVRIVGCVLEWTTEGEPVRLGGTVQDIHDLKQTELQLIDAVELNTLMQFIATAVNETNTLDEALVRIKELLLAHPDWERGVGFDVTGDGLRFRPVGGDDETTPTPREIAVAERALAAGDTVFEEDEVPDKPLMAFPVVLEGAPIMVSVVTNRSPFERHEMLRMMVHQVATQISHVAAREAVAAELAAARDVAMAASQAKSEFLATMSHEIRTPLNGVLGLNELLLRTELDPQQRQYAEAMLGAGRTLLMLLSDILDFSKIEAGRLELEAVPFQPAVVVQGTYELFAPLAATKGISLDMEIDPDVPEQVEGDPSRFGQVLSNLVSNAVKFTTEGGVHVRVSATAADDDVVTLRVAVRDTGIGMDDDQRARIFQPFRQADASTTRTFGGTGLGLTIAHRLVAALGGRIGVASEVGEGSTFWFTGEFTRVASAAGPVRRSDDPVTDEAFGGHILVVEDNEVNQLVAVSMLQLLGYTTEVAVDGAAAAARASAGRFDAVLMDLQMPRLDGFASTRLIRQAEPPGVRVPIIALTASATPGEHERCLAAGMTGFLSKPVGIDALGRVLHEQLSGHVEPGPRVADDEPELELEVELESEPEPESEPVRPVASAVPVLDASRLEELAEMGAESLPLIQRAIDNFVADASNSLDLVRTALAAADAADLRSTAHRIKGSAANLGALRVAELAFTVEELADRRDIDAAEPVVADLATALVEAAGALRDYELVGRADEAYSA